MVWMLRWYLWRRWLTPAEIRDLVYAGMKRGPAQIIGPNEALTRKEQQIMHRALRKSVRITHKAS